MKFAILALLLGVIVAALSGCDNQPTVNPVPQDRPRSNPIGFGPKMTFGPSINLMTGKLEIGPSMGMGPRINF